MAGEQHPNPVPWSDFVTSTTHKTLRGPRSGFILCRKDWARKIDSAVFPGLQGGPLMHVVAAKAIAFREAALPGFKAYAAQTVANLLGHSEVKTTLNFYGHVSQSQTKEAATAMDRLLGHERVIQESLNLSDVAHETGNTGYNRS